MCAVAGQALAALVVELTAPLPAAACLAQTQAPGRGGVPHVLVQAQHFVSMLLSQRYSSARAARTW